MEFSGKSKSDNAFSAFRREAWSVRFLNSTIQEGLVTEEASLA
jgi:hypothetical protein